MILRLILNQNLILVHLMSDKTPYTFTKFKVWLFKFDNNNYHGHSLTETWDLMFGLGWETGFSITNEFLILFTHDILMS